MSEIDIPIEESFLELVHWMSSDDWEHREKTIVQKVYRTFDEAAQAIDDYGTLEICTDRANAFFTRVGGRFEEDIIAVRQSGFNVRRILISKDDFDTLYGDFEGCVNHVLSNNAVGAEVELAHLRDYAERVGLHAEQIFEDRRYDRAEVDATSVLQMMDIKNRVLKDEDEEAQRLINFVFDIGFTAGRNFSAIQNLMYLEPFARKAVEAREKNVEKGKKSGSERRRIERLEKFITAVEFVCAENFAIRPYEEMVLRAAFDQTVPPGAYGHKQFPAYCTAIRSEEPFKTRLSNVSAFGTDLTI